MSAAWAAGASLQLVGQALGDGLRRLAVVGGTGTVLHRHHRLCTCRLHHHPEALQHVGLVLVAAEQLAEEARLLLARELGVDVLVYQDLEALKSSVRDLRPDLESFDCSCFNGEYVTGDVTSEYLDAIELAREGKAPASKADRTIARQMDLNTKTVR